MRVIETLENLEKIKNHSVLTIGNFDGVHIGHQQILTTAKKIADKRKTDAVVMTFEPHPVAVLYPEKAPGVLTTLEMKKLLLQKYGFDSLIVLAVVVEGTDFNFGLNRAGSVDTLRELAAERGFEVFVVPTLQATLETGQTIKVSSTVIRYMLEASHVSDATVALGRPYRLIGKIVAGRGKGKQLGFPTLNMDSPKQIIPAEGVYAGFVEIQDTCEDLFGACERIPAVFSIGQASTYGPTHPLLIEAHLLNHDLEENPADKWMAMDFIEHIRSQHKFKTEKDLAEQIAEDCRRAKEVLLADL
ncbi:MAG: bifunctional riboflavin kinase/FMN adenylyltransferase [Planctomycetota bacterium]|jgi:riboflavin kinase/FMN adenylyltransferase